MAKGSQNRLLGSSGASWRGTGLDRAVSLPAPDPASGPSVSAFIRANRSAPRGTGVPPGLPDPGPQVPGAGLHDWLAVVVALGLAAGQYPVDHRAQAAIGASGQALAEQGLALGANLPGADGPRKRDHPRGAAGVEGVGLEQSLGLDVGLLGVDHHALATDAALLERGQLFALHGQAGAHYHEVFLTLADLGDHLGVLMGGHVTLPGGGQGLGGLDGLLV